MKKRFLLFFTFLFFSATGLFSAGAKETPIQSMVREWGNSFTKIVILIVVVLCIVGLIKFLTTLKK